MNRVLIVTLAALALAGATQAETKPMAGSNLLPQARITLAQARATALKARRGVITDQELEKEPGGSGLRYSFDVRALRVTYEVGVDAANGKVLENAKEGPHSD